MMKISKNQPHRIVPSGRAIAVLAGRLACLVEERERVERHHRIAFERAYPDGRPNLDGVEDYDAAIQRLCEYEFECGLDASEGALNVIDSRIAELNKLILDIPSLTSQALALKARACLTETPLEALKAEGFDRVADLLHQLAQAGDRGPYRL